MKKITLASAITASIFSFSAQADLNNVYVEGALGQAEIESAGDSIKDTSFGLLGGYQVFAKGPLTVGAELGYNQYLSKDTQTPFGKASSTLNSVSLGGKVGYEVIPKLHVFGRVAYESMTQEVKFLGRSASDTSGEFTYGIGVSYEVAKQLTVGTQYKYAALDNDADLSNMNVSLGYQF